MASKHPLLLALPCFLIDQATKWEVVQKFEFGSEHPVVRGFFSLVYWGNTGSAFGMFRNMSAGFVVLSLGTLIGLLIAFHRGSFRDRLNWWGVGFLMGGIMGNVTDRLWHGHVVDFLLFNLHVPMADPWPAFNVADACICTAVGLFLIAAFREGRQDTRGKVPVGGQ